MTQKPFLTRKDLAQAYNVHPDTIARHEKEFGLLAPGCKVVVSSRMILYRAQEALRILSATNGKQSDQKPSG